MFIWRKLKALWRKYKAFKLWCSYWKSVDAVLDAAVRMIAIRDDDLDTIRELAEALEKNEIKRDAADETITTT